jgi:ADP-dependent NAD(P)H-hydrate dehydratase / NAD(P)H-hydrate epimerase
VLTLRTGAPVLTATEMRAAEAAAIAGGVTAETLMGRAAAAAALAIRRFAPTRSALVLCGPGNNGGDGYGVAANLQAAGVHVQVAAAAVPQSEPAARFAARWTGPVVPFTEAAPAPLIVDALFGTGLTRQLGADVQALLDRLRDCGATVVALDVPSGIDSDTGAALGNPLLADLCIAFGAAKRGHVLGVGRRASGRLVIADIGIAVPDPQVRHMAPPQRRRLADDTHKYQRGGVLVIAGSAPGAARLAALCALRAGAGAVTLVGSEDAPPADAIMRASDAAALALLGTAKVRAVAFGPGLADTQRSRDWLLRLIAGNTPLVLDAGALALFDGPQDLFAQGLAPLVLTPHAGEFARLFGPAGPDPVAAVQAAAVVSGAVVLLKGRATIIAAPDGRVAINTHATPWLATAGSGDALTGIIAALLAQEMPPFEAAQAAAWLHGDAGVRGGAGMIADDIARLLPAVLADL